MRLGDVCDIQLGKMLSPKSKTGADPRPYLRNANVQWGRVELSDLATMDFDEREAAKFALRRGDLLVCEGGEPGRSAVWDGKLEPCYYQKALHRLRPRHQVADPHFLMYRLWLGALAREFVGVHGQTTIAHLPAVRLEALTVPMPPLVEQRRIALALADQMAAVERARVAAESQLEAARTLTASYLQGVFEGSMAQGWPRLRVGDLCDSIAYGHTASADFTLSAPRFLRITDIQAGQVDWARVPGCRISPDEERANGLIDGDIVFARTGASTGKSFLVRKPPRAVFASYLIRLRPSRAVRPAYL